MVLWARRPTGAFVPVCGTLVLGYAVICGQTSIALVPWFPLQAPRVLSALNFLISVPVGVAVSQFAGAAFRRAGISPPRTLNRARARSRSRAVAGHAGVRRDGGLPSSILLTVNDFAIVAPILRFAETRHDGMYIVEQVPMNAVGPALDARAISAYLALQGNESAGFVFKESPLSSLLLSPLAGALSAGIISDLARCWRTMAAFCGRMWKRISGRRQSTGSGTLCWSRTRPGSAC